MYCRRPDTDIIYIHLNIYNLSRLRPSTFFNYETTGEIGMKNNNPREKHLMKIISSFFIRPMIFSVILIGLLYLLKDHLLSIPLAVIFILGYCIFIFDWVLSALTEQNIRYKKLIDSVQSTKKISHKKKILDLFTKSGLLYILIIGYILITSTFAVVYDALSLTTEPGFLNNFYFSLTTISAGGGGDISPIGLGRFFTSLEMFFGVAYQILALGLGANYFFQISRLSEKQEQELY